MDSDYQSLKPILADLFKNNFAAELCYDYFIVAQYWDDLIDRDKILNDKEINLAFYTSLVKIPSNPFFIQYSYKIMPILETTIYKWLQSNKYENEKKEFYKSYMLRAGIYDLFAICLLITQGSTTDINIYDLYGEIFEEYIKEFKNA